MKLMIAVLIALIISFSAVNSQEIVLWEENIPFAKPTSTTEHVEKTDYKRISNVVNPSIEVYLAPKEKSTGQAILICPGGGYKFLAYEHEGIDVAKMLNEKGITAFVLKYRLPSDELQTIPHQVPLADAQQAMRIIRSRAREWRLNQIGVMGFSAGGHLAASLSTLYDEQLTDIKSNVSARPDFSILVYPVISMTDEYMHKGSMMSLVNGNEALMNHYSVERQVNKNTPPTIIIHAGDDEVVPVENSLAYYRKLLAHQVEAELHIYPTGGHGFSLKSKNKHLSSWADRCGSWVGEQFRPE